jgi:hypothetical protein
LKDFQTCYCRSPRPGRCYDGRTTGLLDLLLPRSPGPRGPAYVTSVRKDSRTFRAPAVLSRPPLLGQCYDERTVTDGRSDLLLLHLAGSCGPVGATPKGLDDFQTCCSFPPLPGRLDDERTDELPDLLLLRSAVPRGPAGAKTDGLRGLQTSLSSCPHPLDPLPLSPLPGMARRCSDLKACWQLSSSGTTTSGLPGCSLLGGTQARSVLDPTTLPLLPPGPSLAQTPQCPHPPIHPYTGNLNPSHWPTTAPAPHYGGPIPSPV